MSNQQYAVEVKFPEPIHGYWDGGRKGGGTFTPELFRSTILVYSPDGVYHNQPRDEHPGPSNTIRWGCFRLNFWFTSGSGRTWYEAASIAKRKLERMCREEATIEIVPHQRGS